MADITSANIHNLPENILLHILSYLPVKERCISGRVCKQWRRIVSDNSLWRHVDLLQYRLNLPKMWKVLRAHFSSCLLSMKIGGHAHADSLKRKKATISDAMLKDLQKRCPNLHVLHLDHCNNDNLSVSSLPGSLTSLRITHSTWPPQWLKGNSDGLPNLVSLDLSSTTRIDNFDLMDISQLSSLRRLSVSDCYRVKGTGFEVIAKNMPRLQSLNLSSTGVDELSIHHISRHCKDLEELFLRKCENLTDSCLEEISSGLKGLVVLDVSDCSLISLPGLKTLSSLHKLKTLVVEKNKTLTESQLKEVKGGFVQEDLNILL